MSQMDADVLPRGDHEVVVLLDGEFGQAFDASAAKSASICDICG
jgi:hypothetical protein